jgi:hypothetical protein
MGTLRKVFSPIGIAFKGSGFYRTDSRAAVSAKRDGADGSSSKPSSDTTSSTGDGDGSSGSSGASSPSKASGETTSA